MNERDSRTALLIGEAGVEKLKNSRVAVFGVGGGLQSLRDSVTIVTKDGELTGDAKNACIDTSTVSFNRAGFYRFAIKLNVGGQEMISYYALQILAKTYAGNSMFTAYGSGAIFKTNSVVFDEYGKAILNCGGVRYEGTDRKSVV